MMKKCIGWKEHISLPELGIKSLKMKTDSGAATSSLHAEDIEIYRKGKKTFVRCKIVHEVSDELKLKKIDHEVLEFRTIKSSNGMAERRPVIETTAVLFGEKWVIQLTLTDRSLMGFQMLFGRQAMKGRFTIDPAKSFLALKKIK
ncbi:MAG: aspartyl protease [Bdellovibrionales bacterium CG22_combo_CG10-13_8_21_14_all_38_13]|nr:MAG: aspartyl protease [Bdellovibrionales bacterium CG22_combo_CG10-13_8_21_14_all_38_13]